MVRHDTVRAAAVQLSSQADVGANLQRCGQLVAEAAGLGAEVILLPENFAYLGPEAGKRAVAERLGDPQAPIQRAVAEMARAHQVILVAGGFPEASGDPARPYNCCAVYSEAGQLLGSYRKIHLFDVELPDGTQIRESASNTAGDQPVIVTCAGYGFGLSICYDLRFPELYRALVDRGAEVLLVPSAFTLQTGRDHWHVLLRARAIEAQCWVVAANQWGAHLDGRASYGHSLIVDPWGTVVAQCSDRVGVVMAELDRTTLRRVRDHLPSLRHRRL
jgi:deaminated glutathione amidase